tara:strand:- start:6173 stop:6583 length:411 start_codon:yes stop_codon:yes gene_type:complete
MKISKKKLQEIIKEELEMSQKDPNMAPYEAKKDNKATDDVDDLEGDMAKNQLIKMAKYALGLSLVLEDDQQLESWVQAKITLANDYISKVKHYLENELQVDIPDPDLTKAVESCNKEPELPEVDNNAGDGAFYYDV